jgi:hypothetical protein
MQYRLQTTMSSPTNGVVAFPRAGVQVLATCTVVRCRWMTMQVSAWCQLHAFIHGHVDNDARLLFRPPPLNLHTAVFFNYSNSGCPTCTCYTTSTE